MKMKETAFYVNNAINQPGILFHTVGKQKSFQNNLKQ
jgi:hypothetical protein